MSSLTKLPPPHRSPSNIPTPPPDGARLWRVQHVAWVLQCSIPHVDHLTRTRELPSFKLGTGARRYSPAAVDAWIARQQAAAEEAS